MMEMLYNIMDAMYQDMQMLMIMNMMMLLNLAITMPIIILH